METCFSQKNLSYFPAICIFLIICRLKKTVYSIFVKNLLSNSRTSERKGQVEVDQSLVEAESWSTYTWWLTNRLPFSQVCVSNIWIKEVHSSGKLKKCLLHALIIQFTFFLFSLFVLLMFIKWSWHLTHPFLQSQQLVLPVRRTNARHTNTGIDI